MRSSFSLLDMVDESISCRCRNPSDSLVRSQKYVHHIPLQRIRINLVSPGLMGLILL